MNDNKPLRAADFDVFEVSYDDPRGGRIREAMNVEMAERYATALDALNPQEAARVVASLNVDPAKVITTFMAFAPGGAPAAHVMLVDHSGEWEVKRVITAQIYRGTGVSSRVMRAAHDFAFARGAVRLVLQCGDRQPEAAAFYRKLGYIEIPVYEPYKSGVPGSICFTKSLS